MSTSDPATNDAQPRHKPNGPRRWVRRGLRVLKWTLIVVLILLVIIIGVLAWVLGTHAGTEFAWHQANRFLPAELQIDQLDGRLIGPLHVEGLSYESDTMRTSVQRIDFDMDFSALWHLTVHINHLDVDGVEYEVLKTTPPPPEQPDSEPFSLPEQISLPVSVIVDRIAISDVTAITAPDAEPVRVDRLALTGARLDDAQWQIESLTGHGPMFDLDAHARVTPNSGYDTALHAEAALRLPDYAPIQATADVQGSLADLQVRADVAAPYNLSLEGQVTDALSDLGLDLRLQANGVDTTAIADSLPALTATADLTAQGPVNDLDLGVEADVDSADYGRATLNGNLHYTPEQLGIRNLKLGVPATNGQLVANGDVALSEGNAMNVTVDWQRLAWPLTDSPQYRSANGTVTLDGTLDDYNLSTDLAWQVVGQTEGRLAVQGAGSTQAFDLSSLEITGGPGRITGQAQTRWAPSLDVSASLSGQDINIGALVADVPSDFDLSAQVTAKQQDDGTIHATVEQLTANGSLRNQPLELDAKARYLGDHLEIDTLHLVSGAATADITGTYGWTPDARLDGRWSIESSDLSTIMPGLAGSLTSEGRVSGQVKAPVAQATLSANDLDVFGNQIGFASLDADVNWAGSSPSNVDLRARDIEAGGQSIREITLNLDGTPGQHDLSLNLDSDIARAELAMTGSLNKQTYREQFTLRELTAGYGELAPWTLTSPASGAVSAEAQSIEDACLTSGEARVCLTARNDGQGSAADIDLSDVPYDYARPYLPEDLTVAGALSGRVEARLPAGGNPSADVSLQTSGGRVAMTGADGNEIEIVNMQPGSIDAELANNGLDARVNLPLAGGDGINAQVSVAPGSSPITEHALDGQVSIGLNDMDFIAALSPEVDTFDGRLTGDIGLDGTLGEPNVLGTLALRASRIVLVSPGLTLTDVSLVARGHGDNIDLTASAISGGGTLNADGQIALNESGQTIALSITGDRFQVANIPDATAYVSPDLQVEITPSQVSVSGSVRIPEAAITPRNLPESGVTTTSSDQVIVTQEDSATQSAARAIDANVNVILGDDVRIDAFGLQANLGGNVRVVQNPGDAVPTGTGEITITNGSYRAYGQSLDIQSGRILFPGGPISQPGIDIRAARYPNEDVTVGVHVRGSLSEPELTLFSDPTMTQSEQLSWLLLGRPLNDTTGQQSSLVARAALALGSSRGNQILQNIGDRLGVNVGLGAGAGQSSSETALTVGRYLAPNLYINYGLGLFDQISTVSIRYTLSSQWTLETSSSSKGTGGDIIWSFDR